MSILGQIFTWWHGATISTSVFTSLKGEHVGTDAAGNRYYRSKKVKDGLRAMVVPGSGLVRAQAEEEGLADIFKDAGFEWRLAGCSMCLAMNPDQLAPGERCASTSNRNFEGRQGFKGRTHLMSPAMAAAAAITGKLTDVREMM